MKQAYFIRHAKSSWSDLSLSDIDRPLNKRGRRDAPIMASKLAIICPSVDLILCSSAKRTRKTSSYFEKMIEVGEKKILDEIYHASANDLIDIITTIDESVQSFLIFGHNPSFTYVYNHFSKNRISNLPTCGIFGLKCSSSWSELHPTNTAISHLMYPKMYNN